MYKPPTYLEVCLFSYLSAYMWDLFPTEMVPKMKPNIWTQVEVHLQLSNNRHPVDGELVGCWFIMADAMDQKVTTLAQLCNKDLLVSPSHLLISFSNHATHTTLTHPHTKTLLLTSLLSVFTKPYKLQPHQTSHTHIWMEYTNTHKWSKVTMPITEHRMMTNQVKSFDLVWSMHHIFTPNVWTCGVKKLCLVFLIYTSHPSILFCVRPWDKFRTFGCYLHHI
jgi:hypothetical protein